MSSPSTKASTAAASAPANALPFPRATVFWRTATKSSTPRAAWLAISTAVRWRPLATLNEVAPISFAPFRGQPCLALERLSPDKEWEDVEQAVHPTSTQHGHGLCIPGRLSRSAAGLLRSRDVTLIVATDSVDQRNSWMEAVRIRIAPWQILHRRFKRELLNGPLSQDVLHAIFQLGKKRHNEQNTTQATDCVEPLENATAVTDGVENLAGFVETVATVVKTCASHVGNVKEVAESVADVANCVTVVSSAVTVVVLCATVVEMGMEVKRGEKELPRLQSIVQDLRGHVVTSIVRVLHPDGNLDELLVKDVFETQEQLFDVLARAEKQMMRNVVARFWNAGELVDIEQALGALERCVVDVVQSGSIAVNSRSIALNSRKIDANSRTITLNSEAIATNTARISQLENSSVENGVPPMRFRPKVNSYFAGREDELTLLEQKLKQYGSVAIMQFGGVGKTQFATAFAEKAEQSGWVPGGSFWIGAHGGKSQIMHSLADFAESLTKRCLRKEDREEADIVLSTLRRKLESISGNWLLILDNADDSQVNPIIGNVASLAQTAGGWVIVTSRQGGSTLWEDMCSEQKLQLNPFDKKHAMIALYRRKNKCLRKEASDAQIMRLIDQMKQEDGDEFRALEELAGDEREHGLAGHALALAQAGSYMHRFHVSFSRYIEFYTKKRRESSAMDVFRTVEDDGLSIESQRSIWLTWKISVDGLSDIGRAVLRSFALFDHAPVPISLVRKLDSSLEDDSVEFLKVVHDDLVNGASLIQMSGEGLHMKFGMHRLIREYVTTETKSGDEMWFQSVIRAVRALHESVSDELRLSGHSIKNPPKSSCSVEARALLPHVMAVLLNHVQDSWLGSGRIVDSSYVVDLFRFAHNAHEFLGRLREAATLCDRRCKALTVMHGNADDWQVANALIDAGYVASENGAHKKAKEMIHKGLEMYKRMCGEGVDHRDVATTLHELGNIAFREGEYEEAEMRFEESLSMERRIHGEGVDHRSVAITLQWLGVVSYKRTGFEKAAELMTESLEMWCRLLGNEVDHPEIANVLMWLGRTMEALGRKEEAEEWKRKFEEMESRIRD